MTLIVNLWGGPGSGKSTTAAGLFARMKLAGAKVELAHEFAKEVVYKGDLDTLEDQWYVTGHQANRLRRLVGKVDFVINDSPLPLGIVYAKPPFTRDWFTEAIWGLYDTFRNTNFWIQRVRPYAQYGRVQSEAEAHEVDITLKDIYRQANTRHPGRCGLIVDGDEGAPEDILYGLGLNDRASGKTN